VRRPVFRFEAELLTDAPFEHIVERLGNNGPSAFRCLRPLGIWAPVTTAEGHLVLRWARTVAGTEESGEVAILPDLRGAHLRLQGCLKGWMGFLLLGLLRWRTDRLLDRLVEEL
jgi:hypothetical protein